MDDLNLKHELTLLLEKEVGFTGKYILEKQCRNLNIEVDDIDSDNLGPLADRITWAIKGYTGDKRAEDIKRGILEYRKALETVESAIENTVDEEEGWSAIARVKAQLTISDTKFSLGLLPEAEDALRKALEMLDGVDSENLDELRVKVTRHLARIMSRSKDSLDGAKVIYMSCVALGEKTHQHYDVALSWDGLGAIAWRAGEHKKALEYYSNALKSIQPMQTPSKKAKTKKRSAEAMIKSGLGNVHLDLVEMESAIRYNEEALLLSKNLENWGEVGRIYNNLARVYEEMKKFNKAIDHYERGIRYSRDAGMLRMEGWTLTNLASALIENGRVTDALIHLERAGRVLSDFNDHIAHSKLNCMWGKYHKERREWSQGIERFRKSIEYVSEVNAPDYLATAEEEFGTLYQKKGDLDKARELLVSALEWYKLKEETNHIERIEEQLKEIGQ